MNFRTKSRLIFLLAAIVIMALVLPSTAADIPDQLPNPDGKPAADDKPVKVFILLGQSNMLGFGRTGPEDKNGTLTYLTKNKGKYPRLVDDEGSWAERKDVRYVQVMHRNGKMSTLRNEWLTVKGNHIGPELQFGHIMGYMHDEPVLLLKTCIGNRSLGWDLLPPGSERYEFEGKIYAGYKESPLSWDKGTKPEPINWYAGKQYDDDIGNAKKVLANIGEYYPGAKNYEVAGFVWWQGHKDQNPAHASRYEQNLVHLIKTLRKEFDAPEAKFVLATIAFGGKDLSGHGLTVANAQLAVSGEKGNYPEFKGNVKAIDARPFWRDKSVSPSGAGHHYNHNAETYMEVGDALGRAMADLLMDKSTNEAIPTHGLVGLRPLPRFAADLKSNHGGPWAGLPTFDKQKGQYPFVAEHLDIVKGWLDGDFKTKRVFFEYYWGLSAARDDLDPEKNSLVKVIAHWESKGGVVEHILICREYRLAIYRGHPDAEPGPFKEDTRILSAKDVDDIRALFRNAHEKGLLKHDNYRLIQMVEEPTFFAEDPRVHPIIEKMEGVAYEAHQFNRHWPLETGWSKPEKVIRGAKWTLDQGKEYIFYYGPVIWKSEHYYEFIERDWLYRYWKAGLPKHHPRMHYYLNTFPHAHGRGRPIGPEADPHSVLGLTKWLIREIKMRPEEKREAKKELKETR